MRCFYCNKIEIGHIENDLFPESEREHLFRVLRAKAGRQIILIDGKGNKAIAHIEHNRSIYVDNIESIAEPAPKLHLFVAPPRKQKMDQMLKQCSEIGAWSITLIDTERGVAKPEKKSLASRMQRHLIEGCKQSGNPFLPAISENLIPLPKALDVIKTYSDAVAFFGAISKNDPGTISIPGKTTDILWFVGPEGGFTDTEIHMMEEAGVVPLSLGKWTMRTETAAIIGAYTLISRSVATHNNLRH